MKTLLFCTLSAFLLTSCSTAVVDNPTVFNADQAQGMVFVGYKQYPFSAGQRKVIVNWEQGQVNASRVCRNWGYSGAQNLNDELEQTRDSQWVYFFKRYQCIK